MDISYEIVRRLRYGDDDDDDDDNDDDDDDENEKGIPGIRSYAPKDRRHVVVFLLKRPTDRSFSAAQCARSWLV
ncbi:hypothetical protein RF55_4828 [Lasius niger]|uniref:Uncharacterized protein n=1 Tax=Lasius niger TaxID=67767 RepID=A0A0J7KXH7_LASNI|nr:hypothetical protein RF55_4828 [Lasius niger]